MRLSLVWNLSMCLFLLVACTSFPILLDYWRIIRLCSSFIIFSPVAYQAQGNTAADRCANVTAVRQSLDPSELRKRWKGRGIHLSDNRCSLWMENGVYQ